VSNKWRPAINFATERLFHTCGKPVEMMSVDTMRVAASKALQQIDGVKPFLRAERT
jgi:hypothetical protein